MSWIRRFGNVFRQDRLNREIDEELAAHLEGAMEQGHSADEARQTLGSALQYREQSRDIKLLPWLESLVMLAIAASLLGALFSWWSARLLSFA